MILLDTKLLSLNTRFYLQTQVQPQVKNPEGKTFTSLFKGVYDRSRYISITDRYLLVANLSKKSDYNRFFFQLNYIKKGIYLCMYTAEGFS